MVKNIKTKLNPAGFLEIFCDNDHYITTWDEGDDILKFNSFQITYVNPNTDLSKYHCITKDKNTKLRNERNEKLELLKEERERERQKERQN